MKSMWIVGETKKMSSNVPEIDKVGSWKKVNKIKIYIGPLLTIIQARNVKLVKQIYMVDICIYYYYTCCCQHGQKVAEK